MSLRVLYEFRMYLYSRLGFNPALAVSLTSDTAVLMIAWLLRLVLAISLGSNAIYICLSTELLIGLEGCSERLKSPCYPSKGYYPGQIEIQKRDFKVAVHPYLPLYSEPL